MSLIISIDCQSVSIGGEQREARVETTATGVKWTISGKLAAAIHRMIQENGLTNEQNDRLQAALAADRLAALRMARVWNDTTKMWEDPSEVRP